MVLLRATRVSSLCRPWARIRSLATAPDGQNFNIPIIEFNKYLNSQSHSEKQGVANEIVSAFRHSGFIYLKNHGIADSVIQNAFQKSAELFSLPNEAKDELRWEDPRSNRGYVQIGRERVTQSSDAEEIAQLRARAPDCKETMEIGRELDSLWKNRWPQESKAPDFKDTMLNFYQSCHELHVQVMRSIALGLGLQEDFFDDKIHDQCHNLRLLSYPPIQRHLLENEGQARAGAHSDYGTLTLLFQDMVGGLQVQNPNTGEYIAATPVPGTIVINVGDLLSRWSNDVLRSTLHRVVAPPAKKVTDEIATTPKRQSIAFFSNPNFSATISCLPGCGEPRYDPVNVEEYIVGRLSATYM